MTKRKVTDNWIDTRIRKMSKLNRYVKPEKIEGSIKLDSNENFALDGEFIKSIARQAAGQVDLREYPLDQLDQLYLHLERYTGIGEQCIAAGSGSDQLIELLLSTLGGRRATVFTPTFSYFVNRCELHNIEVDRVALSSNFDIDGKEFLSSASRSDLIYVCSPNNPTGNQFDRRRIVDIVDSLDDGKLVLVDEAYVDFADYSLSSYATKCNNLVILRTLSKAFGLAGARVGYMIANERFVNVFRSIIQSPYPISILSLAIASSVLGRSDYVKETIEKIRSERGRVAGRLSRLDGIRTYRSDANFVFIETGKNYENISKALKTNGVVVKLLGTIAGHRGCMRATIGTPEMNESFLRSVEGALR